MYRAGGTVLLHDTKKDTIEALPEMLDRFVAEADRLRLVTVDELLEKKYPSTNR